MRGMAAFAASLAILIKTNRETKKGSTGQRAKQSGRQRLQ